MDFYKTLEEIMRERNMSIPEVARACGLSDGTIRSIIVRKSQNVSLEVAFKLSAGLGVSLERLNGDTPKNKKTAPPELSDEARQIAKNYDKLTHYGKGAVKAILSYEEKVLSEHRKIEDDAGKVITMPKRKRNGAGLIEFKVYDQPSAAGLGNYLDEPDYHIEQYPADVIPADADFGIIISGSSMEPKVHDGGTVFVQAMPSIESGKIGIFVLNGKSYCKKLNVDRENQQVRLVSINPEYEDIVVSEYDDLRTVGRVLGQWTHGYKQDLFGW